MGEAAGVCCRCCLEAAPAPVCWRNSKWWCSAAPQLKPRGSQPRTAQKDGEARRRNFPRPPGRAGTGRRSRRWRRKRPTKLRGRRYVAHGTSHQDPAKRAAGETDGNHGESTGTGFGPRQRQRTRTRAAGSCQQHPRQRQLFRFSQRSNNGAASGTCNRPGIAQFHGTAFTRRNPRFPISAAPRQANVR